MASEKQLLDWADSIAIKIKSDSVFYRLNFDKYVDKLAEHVLYCYGSYKDDSNGDIVVRLTVVKAPVA